ncbi:hypothetical protein BX666DRAFT_1967627 [Dichotomocladium elegans]|nr:hypothetical protein BX666DRAFT_1967627 [Dichotomocladium elegans]
MLFWPKLLSIAHAIASSARPYLPLYLSHLLGFSCSAIGILLAVPLALRVASLGLWTMLVVDQRPLLHGFFMALLTAIGTAALILILWIPPRAAFAWPAALFCMVLDGIFYQPLTVLIDSAIIKILGNLKMTYYDSQRQWGDLAGALMAVSIGWSLDDDHDFDTLMGTILIGAVLLFLVSLSTTVIPIDLAQLGLSDEDQLLPLLKPLPATGLAATMTGTGATNLHYIPIDSRHHSYEQYPQIESIHIVSAYHYNDPPPRYTYKPYCLFNEQLSHISEEDASMLQRTSSQNNTIKAPPESIASGGTTTATIDTPFRSSSQYWANTTTASTTANNIQQCDDLFAAMPSLQLALMPSPPPETPMIVLPVACLSNLPLHLNGNDMPDDCSDDDDDDLQQDRATTWSVYSLLATIFLIGSATTMMNSLAYIYLHDGLGLPMHVIGMIGMVSMASKAIAKPLVQNWANRYSHHVVVVAHLTLIFCAFGYTLLKPPELGIHAAVVALQILQALSFNVLWYIAVEQVDAVLLVAGQHQRMMLRGKMSAMFYSIGPAVGAVATGFLVDLYDRENILTYAGFLLSYRCTMAVVGISLVVSRGWSPSLEEQ